MHKKNNKKRKNKQPKIIDRTAASLETQNDQTIIEIEESKDNASKL